MSGHWEDRDGKPIFVKDGVPIVDELEKELLGNNGRKYTIPAVDKEIQEVKEYIMNILWSRTEEKGEYWEKRHENIDLLSDEDIDKLKAYHVAQKTGDKCPFDDDNDENEDDEEEEEEREYRVYFSRTAYESLSIEVTAKDEDEARNIAWDLINEGDNNWSTDDYGDEEIDNIEEI